VAAPGAAAAAPHREGTQPAVTSDGIPAVDVVVTVENFGDFRIRLDRDRVPNHVAAFLSLAASGAYDNLGFHRIIPDYLVQIGDPTSRDEDPGNDGSTVPEWRIPAEPTDATHVRGTVSMAWLGNDPGSAGSQWFVTLSDLPQLDGHATPIGEVVEGMDVVEGISQVSTFRNRHPLRLVRVESVELVAAVSETAKAAPTKSDSTP
jgi:peptidyl-prolyl cis-trans isomerase B (cyclophilin B)